MTTARWIKPQRYLKDTKALAYRHKRQMHSSVQCFWSTSASKAWKKKRKAQSQSVKAPRWCTREKPSAGLNNIWQAKTPDLPLLFCSTGFHLNNMFPLTICKARAALVSHTQHFQPWNTISIYPNSEPVSIFLLFFFLYVASETDGSARAAGDGSRKSGRWFYDHLLGFWCVSVAMWTWWLRGTKELLLWTLVQ